jgi:hypothetical protein
MARERTTEGTQNHEEQNHEEKNHEEEEQSLTCLMILSFMILFPSSSTMLAGSSPGPGHP